VVYFWVVAEATSEGARERKIFARYCDREYEEGNET
jgi:hypothetical protein